MMNDQKTLWYLENIDVTGLFCPQKMGAAHESQTHKQFKKGQYIYLPEEHADKIFFLTEGRVKIGNYGDSGKEITKAILNPGEVFGELSLIGETVRRDFAYAMEKTSCCVLSVEEMKGLMRNHELPPFFVSKTNL